MSDIAAARKSLIAGDLAAARDALIAAWLDHRSPALGDMIDTIDGTLPPDALRAQLAAAITPRVVTTTPNVTKLKKVDDPRACTWAIAQLRLLPFVTPGAEDLLLALVAIAARDPRFVAAAPQIREGIRTRIGRLAPRTKIMKAIDRAVAKIAQPGDGEDLAPLAKLVEPMRKQGRDADTLLADIYAHPTDDAPRLVYADLLTERGDPRGEFITLQLEGKATEREAELLKKHGKQWLGPLAPVISWGKGYSDSAFRRGFLAKADIILSVGKKLEPILHDPAWSTVEEFGRLYTKDILFSRTLVGLRTLEHGVDEGLLQQLATHGQRFPHVTTVRLDELVTPATLHAVFPALRAIRVYASTDRDRPLSELRPYAPEIEVTHNWYDAGRRLTEGRAAFETQLATILAEPAFCDRLTLQRPYSGRAEAGEVILVRDGDRFSAVAK